MFGPGTGFLACESSYGRRLPSLSWPVARWRLLAARDREKNCSSSNAVRSPAGFRPRIQWRGRSGLSPLSLGHFLVIPSNPAATRRQKGGICREGPLPGSWFRFQRSSSPSRARINLLPPLLVRSQARRTPCRPRESEAIVERHAWRSQPELAHERERSDSSANRWERAAIRQGCFVPDHVPESLAGLTCLFRRTKRSTLQLPAPCAANNRKMKQSSTAGSPWFWMGQAPPGWWN